MRFTGLISETGNLGRLAQRNGYATSLRVTGDGKTAVFLKWPDPQATQVTNVLYLLDGESHNLTPLIVAGLD